MPSFNTLKRIIPIIAIAAFLISGCSGGNKISTANKAYEIGEYDRAAAQFKQAYRKEKNRYTKGEISYYLGQCYRNINQPKKAATAFSRAVRYKYELIDSELFMADAYLASGKVEEAMGAYESYLEKQPRDRRAHNGLASCKLVLNDSVITRYEIEKIKGLNTTKYSDFSPGYASTDYDQIYFSSMRTEKKKRKKSRITGQGGSNIYVSRIDSKGKWTDPEALSEEINTDFDEGSATMSDDGKEMYFTRCT